MKQFLQQVSEHIKSDFDGGFDSYEAMKAHPGWSVHRSIIGNIKIAIVKEMLSERFTKLTANEKDSQQKAFFMVDEILNYLLNPLEREIKRQDFRMKFDKAMGINPVTGKNLNERR